LVKKDVPIRTEWYKHSLERDVAAFRPKEDICFVWHLPSDDVPETKNLFQLTGSRYTAGMQKETIRNLQSE